MSGDEVALERGLGISPFPKMLSNMFENARRYWKDFLLVSGLYRYETEFSPTSIKYLKMGRPRPPRFAQASRPEFNTFTFFELL